MTVTFDITTMRSRISSLMKHTSLIIRDFVSRGVEWGMVDCLVQPYLLTAIFDQLYTSNNLSTAISTLFMQQYPTSYFPPTLSYFSHSLYCGDNLACTLHLHV